MNAKAIIIMGSEKDMDFSREVAKHLKAFLIDYELRVASAHKTPQKVLDIINEYEKEQVIYITVAGRSNALSAFVDANTIKPVIACPPYSEKYCGVDIYSSLRTPSGIGTVVTIEPEAAAIATAKILALSDRKLAQQIRNQQETIKGQIEKADQIMRKTK
jgi:5-(carboxyamino)imidazole ribonucleotide mutase